MPEGSTKHVWAQRLKSAFYGMMLGLLIPALGTMTIPSPAFGQATLAPNAALQYTDDANVPLASGQVFYYQPNTTTLKTVWQDAAETTPQPNPVQLDAAGRPQPAKQTYIDGCYQQKVVDVNNIQIWSAITCSTGGGSGGGTPSSEGVMVGTIIPWVNTTLPAQYLYTDGSAVNRTTYAQLLTALTYSTTILCQTGIATISVSVAISNALPIGAPIEATCFAPGTVVTSKSSGSLTMSNNATVTTSVSAVFFPWGDGDRATTFNLPFFNGRTLVARNNAGIGTGPMSQTYYGVNPNANNAVGGSSNGSATLLLTNLPPITPAGIITNGEILVGGNNTFSLALQNGSTYAPNAGSNTGATNTSATVTQGGSTFAGTAGGGSSTPFSIVQPSVTVDYIIKALPDDSPTGPGVSSIGGMTGAIACGANVVCDANTISVTIPPDTVSPSQNACVRMWPSIGQGSTPWNVIDAYGDPVITVGSTSQGLQEAINYSINNGQCLQVYGQGTLSLGSQSASLHSNTIVDGINTTTLLAGDYVTAAAGNGIPAFTTIISVDSPTQIHISNAATVTATRTLTFTRPPGPNHQTFITSTSTITISPFEQWYASFFGVNITFSNTVTGPGIQFDSGIIGGFDFVGGQIVYQPASPTASSFAVLIAPTNPVPIDGILATADGHIYISNIASPATGGLAAADVGVNISGGSVTNLHLAFDELNGTGTGSSGSTTNNFVVFGATPSTAFENNIIDIGDAHLSAGPAIEIGVNTTNAGNYRNNLYKIGGMKPSGASQSAGISSFGAYDTFQIGSVTNEQGTLVQGINLQAGSVGNKVSYGQIIGAGTALLDAGTCNSWAGANGTKTAIYGTTSGCTTIIPQAVASGTLTLPAATDQLMGRATTDTETNKTISGSSNTLSNIGNSSLTNSSTTVNSQTCTLGGTCTVTATATAALTFGTHLISGGTSYNGSTAITITSDATNANTVSTIVSRDASGNFSAGTITAALTGHASLDLALSSLGANVQTALATNVGTAGAFVVNGGALGMPSSGVGTNLTGTAAGLTAGNVTTNANLIGAITSSGNTTSLGSFTSANLSGALSDETGIGSAVFGTNPILSTVDARGTWTTGTSWTLPAHTWGGTVAGGGNQLNNVIIGTTTPLAGFFTTASATTSITSPLHYGGSAAGSVLSLISTSSGAPSGDRITFTTGGVVRGTWLSNGFLGLGTETNPQATLVLSGNAATGLPLATGTQFGLIGVDGGGTTFDVDSYNNGGAALGGAFAFRTARGTGASPANLVSGDLMGAISGRGYINGNFTNAPARMAFTYNDTSPNLGTYVEFDTTAAGSTSRNQAMRLMAGVIVGTGTTDPGIGNINVGGYVTPSAGFTVSTLPASPPKGSIAYVTDAVACTFLASLTGGGTTYCPVTYNGSAWLGG